MMPQPDRLKAFLAAASASPAVAAAGLRRVDEPLVGEVSVAEVRRRRLRRRPEEGIAYLSLLQDEDGLLRWEADSGASPGPSGTAVRAGRRGLATLGLVEQYKFTTVRGSEIAAFLDGLDTSFNPVRGLRAWSNGTFDASGAPVVPAPKGSVLLVVHGTFSKGDGLFEGLQSTAEGAEFLRRAGQKYSQILSFEHPTLAVSPILNALDLARAFSQTAARVDVVCHSRGGLVARWWLEALNANPRLSARVVFVGSPLQGTSLASPVRLRTALNLMTNVIVAMEAAGQLASLAVPLFGVIAGLMRLLSSVTGGLAGAPIVDAAVAMIPGLAAQSRRGPAGHQVITGNFELDRLSGGLTQVPKDYFVVKCNFEPADAGWAFWKYFMQASERLSDLGADLVFPGENDLVVDTASMDALSDALKVTGAKAVFDFHTSAVVHHLNYFAQPETAAFIRKCLGV